MNLRRCALMTLGLALLFGAAQACAADMLAAISQRIASVEVLRGRFDQEKQVAGFRKPLRSSGQFVLKRGQGVIWETTQPFASTLVVTREHLRSQSGGVMQHVDASREPGLHLINGVLFDLLGGEITRLQRDFDVTGELLDGQSWRLQLTPKPGALAQAFTRITLSGAAHVEQVRLDERNGDRSVINFSALAPAIALSNDEAKQLVE